jgi:membrane protease subunit HflK
MKQVVGNQSFDEAISIARIENEGASKEGLQKLLDDFQTGIHIVSVNLQSCNPPKGVRDAFNGVNRAMQKKDQKINEAMKNYNEEIPMAIGKAEETVKTAEGYATKRVNEAMGDANKFDAVYGAYFRAPEVTKQRLLFETMSRVLPTMREKWIVDEKAMNGGFMNLLHMNANKSGGQK